VRRTGWTVRTERTATYMAFRGCGAVQIASAERTAGVVCMLCEARLMATEAELRLVAWSE